MNSGRLFQMSATKNEYTCFCFWKSHSFLTLCCLSCVSAVFIIDCFPSVRLWCLLIYIFIRWAYIFISVLKSFLFDSLKIYFVVWCTSLFHSLTLTWTSYDVISLLFKVFQKIDSTPQVLICSTPHLEPWEQFWYHLWHFSKIMVLITFMIWYKITYFKIDTQMCNIDNTWYMK